MNSSGWPSAACVCALLFAASASSLRAADDDVTRQVSVPVVMEAATIRGKVAILETRQDDRRVIEGLKVQIWSTKRTEQKRPRLWSGKADDLERDKLLHETETDDQGIFDLPLLGVGEFFLVISKVQFRLTVVEQSVDRTGQTEPKVLLILIPKEVVEVGD